MPWMLLNTTMQLQKRWRERCLDNREINFLKLFSSCVPDSVDRHVFCLTSSVFQKIGHLTCKSRSLKKREKGRKWWQHCLSSCKRAIVPFAKAYKPILLGHNPHLCPITAPSPLHSLTLSARSPNASICDSWFRMSYFPKLKAFLGCVSLECSLIMEISSTTAFSNTNIEKNFQQGGSCFSITNSWDLFLPYLFYEPWVSTHFTGHFSKPWPWCCISSIRHGGVYFRGGEGCIQREVECSVEVGKNSGLWLIG